MHKIITNFAFKRWTGFTAGVDVGHVTSAMTAGLWALEEDKLFQIAEYYHDNSKEKYLESIELAREILQFFQQLQFKFKFQELTCYVEVELRIS
jgi:hypothetical protein